MVAITPDRAAASKGAIDGESGANGKPANAGDERAAVIGLDDGVEVIHLDRERHDSEVTIRSPSDG